MGHPIVLTGIAVGNHDIGQVAAGKLQAGGIVTQVIEGNIQRITLIRSG